MKIENFNNIDRKKLVFLVIVGLVLVGSVFATIRIMQTKTTSIQPAPTNETGTISPTISPVITIALTEPTPPKQPQVLPSSHKEREELIGAYYNPLVNELFFDKFDTGWNQWVVNTGNIAVGKMISTQPEGQGLLTGDHVLMLKSTGSQTASNKIIPEVKSGILRFESYSRARPENHWYDLDWFSVNIGDYRIRWVNSYNGTIDGENTKTLNIVNGGFTGEWQYNIGSSDNPIWIKFGEQELTCNCEHFGGSGRTNHLARKYSPLYLRMDIDIKSNEYVEFQSNDKIWKLNNIKPAEKAIPKDIGFSIKSRNKNLSWLAIDSVFLSTSYTNTGINKIKFDPIPRRSGLIQPLDHIYSYDYFDKGLRGWSPMGSSTSEKTNYIYNDLYKGIPVLTGVHNPFSKMIWPIKRLSWLFPNNVKWETIIALEDVDEIRFVSDTQMGVAQFVSDDKSFKRRFFEWIWNRSEKTWYIVDRGNNSKLIKIGDQDLPQNEFIYISVEYNLKTGNFTTLRSMDKTWNIDFYNVHYADYEKWYLANLINFGWWVKFGSPNGKIHVESTIISGN